MSYIIDLSNVKSGGGKRIALTFVEKIGNTRMHADYVIIVSRKDYFEYGERFPTLNIVSFYTYIGHFIFLIRRKHNVYFTLFGPGKYLSFRANRRLSGIAIPHIIYRDYFIETNPSLLLNIKVCIQKIAFCLFFNEYWTETQDAKNRLRLFIKDTIHVIPNSIDEGLLNINFAYDSPLENRVFIPSAYYSHKNLEFIFRFARSKFGSKYDFIFTLSPEKFRSLKDGASNCFNVGYLSRDNLSKYYQSSRVVLSLSSLEVFSGNYVESVYFGVPIVVLRRSFVESVLKDYPIYINSLNFEELDEAIHKSLSVNYQVRESILSRFTSSKHEELYRLCFS